MRHVSVWPAYVLHITLYKNVHTQAHTHTTESELQMDWRKYFWSKFLSGPMVAQITWKTLPAGNSGVSRSLAYSLCRFSSVSFFLCCSIFPFLWLITSYKHSPLQHKRSQYVGSNDYVMWQLDSGSLGFPAWFMYDSQTRLAKFDFLHHV